MIATQSVELRAGARLLVKDVAVRINSGDRIGFVGRNGAGKSTLAKCLAGEILPAGGQITRTGTIGYLPQDPRTGDQEESVINRILSARGLDQIVVRMRKAEEAMATATPEELELALERYARVDSEFNAAGGYGASAEAESIATNLGLPERLKVIRLRGPKRSQRSNSKQFNDLAPFEEIVKSTNTFSPSSVCS